ncbi:Curli production assembly/transport component CsgG [Phycisphaerae bacterium RAS1]|nr:Curli production assembly/transport component CsgG [Phycisphaerae bacterium RAS1]
MNTSARLFGAAVAALLLTLLPGCLINVPIYYYASYEIASDPPGAHVFKPDGTYVGETPTQLTLRRDGKDSEKYRLTFVKRGYQSTELPLLVRYEYLLEDTAVERCEKLLAILEQEMTPETLGLAPVPLEKRAALAVIDFDVGKGIESDVGKAAADLCRDALARTQQYKLMDRNNIRSILGERDFAEAVRCEQTTCLTRFGKLLEVHYLAHGRITRLRDEQVLHLGIVSVETAELVGQVTAVCPKDTDQLRSVVASKSYELVAASLKSR